MLRPVKCLSEPHDLGMSASKRGERLKQKLDKTLGADERICTVQCGDPGPDNRWENVQKQLELSCFRFDRPTGTSMTVLLNAIVVPQFTQITGQRSSLVSNTMPEPLRHCGLS